MDILRLIETFIEVAKHNSFILAAERLDISASMISRQVAALEKHLGVRLLNRTTRAVSLTGAGQEYYIRVQQIISDLKDTEAIISQQSLNPRGKLRISAPLSFGIAKLGGLIVKFIEKYPDIEPEIYLNDQLIDLADDRIDVAIRISRKLDESLIVRKICEIGVKVCVSPEYIKEYGMPQTPYDLQKHKLLSYSYLADEDIWSFSDTNNKQHNIKIYPIVKSNNGDILAQMAAYNAGVVIQPSFIVDKEIATGRLVEILTDWKINNFTLYAVFLSRKLMPLKIRSFIDFLVQEMEHNVF